jgi:ligand-binding sensor domain-containing protein
MVIGMNLEFLYFNFHYIDYLLLNCHSLYSAIAHQLNTTDGSLSAVMDYKMVRHQCAQFMREHPEDFLPFIESDTVLDDQGYAAYCERVAESAEWGGQVEVLFQFFQLLLLLL